MKKLKLEEEKATAPPGPLSFKLEFYARKFNLPELQKLIEQATELLPFQELMTDYRRWGMKDERYFKLRAELFKIPKMQQLSPEISFYERPLLDAPFQLHCSDAKGEKDASLEIFRILEEDIGGDLANEVFPITQEVIIGGAQAIVKLHVLQGGARAVEKEFHFGCDFDHELKVYQKLQALQGIYIPKVLESANEILTLTYEGANLWYLYINLTPEEMDHLINARFIKKALRALREIHQLGIRHGDIALRNIVVDGNGNPKFIDFGYARMNDSHVSREQEEIFLLKVLGSLITDKNNLLNLWKKPLDIKI